MKLLDQKNHPAGKPLRQYLKSSFSGPRVHTLTHPAILKSTKRKENERAIRSQTTYHNVRKHGQSHRGCPEVVDSHGELPSEGGQPLVKKITSGYEEKDG